MIPGTKRRTFKSQAELRPYRKLLKVQSNLVIRNFLVILKLFLNAKCSLSLWSKLTSGHGKSMGNGALTPISTLSKRSLSKRSLSLSLTVIHNIKEDDDYTLFRFIKNMFIRNTCKILSNFKKKVEKLSFLCKGVFSKPSGGQITPSNFCFLELKT